MNFKRNLFVITCSLVCGIALSSCNTSRTSNFVPFSFINEIEDKHETIDNGSYIKYGDYDGYKVNVPKEVLPINLGSSYDVIKNHGGEAHIPSEGEQKLLVIPVQFTDYDVSKVNLSKENYIKEIKKVFFGNAENNSYVSVSEYFNRSSYGKLKLSGMVCDAIYNFPISVKEIKKQGIKRDELANTYYPMVVDWFKTNYPDEYEEYKIPGLPSSKSLPIFMVFTYPGILNDDDPVNFFWAYTFSNVPLSWASVSFMNLKYGEPDAHTFIHETGHLLGLKDYYPTNGDDKVVVNGEEITVPDPTARIDMMDCSIGDQTSYSKMFLNWTRPYYVKDSCTIDIKSFTDTGDVILLSDSWNNTAFDEYYLIELYTPTGLNTYDVSYGNSQAKLPTVPGIKVYHVDSRLAYFSGGGIPLSYCEEGFGTPSLSNIALAHDNNTYAEPEVMDKDKELLYSFQKKYLYQLILNHSKGMISGCATNINLFRAGDSLTDLPLNKGGALNFKITVEKLEFSNAKIKIEKTGNN